MIKGSITLKNSSIVQFECGTAAEFVTLMSSLNGAPVSHSTPAVNNEMRVKGKGGRPKGSKNGKRHYRKQVEWTASDIVGVARIVRENISLKSGLSTIVKSYIRKVAQNKKRSDAVIYSITSDMKQYFRGDLHAIGKNMTTVLEAAGITPPRSNESRSVAIREA